MRGPLNWYIDICTYWYMQHQLCVIFDKYNLVVFHLERQGSCLFWIHFSLDKIQMWHHLQRFYTIFKQASCAKVLQLSKTVEAWIYKNVLHLTPQNLPLKRFPRTPNALLMQWTKDFKNNNSAPVWKCAFWFMKQLTAAFSIIECPHFSLG